MTHISEVVDQVALNDLVREGFIRKQVHPDEPYDIYNYTEKAQSERHWTRETKTARGLVVHRETGEVVARPFPKFFNLGEHNLEVEDLLDAWGAAHVYEKMDGSLGILYPRTKGGYSIATRGSFTSEQAVWASRRLSLLTPDWEPEPGLTYLFEIIYPENRIVLDYQGREDLVLLAVIDIATGQSVLEHSWPGSVVPMYSIDEVDLHEDRPGHEGYVLYFPKANERVKIKHAEYVRLHKLVTGVTERSIWELMSTGKPLDELLTHVPDEFYAWVMRVYTDLLKQFWDLRVSVWGAFDDVYEAVGLPEYSQNFRKEFAYFAKRTQFPAPLFTLLDGRDIDEWVWKQIRPEHRVPNYEEIPA